MSKNKRFYSVFSQQPALRYDCVVQTTGDTWHIPYKDVFEEKFSFQVPKKWLCIQQK